MVPNTQEMEDVKGRKEGGEEELPCGSYRYRDRPDADGVIFGCPGPPQESPYLCRK